MFRMLPWLTVAVAAPAAAQVVPPATMAAPPVAAVPEPSAAEVLLEFRTVATRMTVPVTIGERHREESWPFVVDTGAERTVVSRELAATLGLAAGPRVRVVAMTGPADVGSVLVPRLAVSSIAAVGLVSPALAARDLGAAGMVGVDALQQHSVVIDFERQRMTLSPSRKRRRAAGPNDVVVSARSLYGQLIVTDARWRGKRIAVVIDTGTPVSLGNLALRRLMRDAKPAGRMSFVSATGGELSTEMVTTGGVEVGGIGFSSLGMAIADAAPFHRFGLGDTPALLMGMDILRLFRVVRIDFPNREIRFTMPVSSGVRLTGV